MNKNVEDFIYNWIKKELYKTDMSMVFKDRTWWNKLWDYE